MERGASEAAHIYGRAPPLCGCQTAVVGGSGHRDGSQWTGEDLKVLWVFEFLICDE